MKDMWTVLSDDEDDDDSVDGQQLEYDMWEGQFDLIDTNLAYGCLSDGEYSERFSWVQKYRWLALIRHN